MIILTACARNKTVTKLPWTVVHGLLNTKVCETLPTSFVSSRWYKDEWHDSVDIVNDLAKIWVYTAMSVSFSPDFLRFGKGNIQKFRYLYTIMLFVDLS